MEARNLGDDDLYLGIDALDDQHRHLLEVMNRLLAACGGGESRLIDDLASEFVDSVRDHIRSEEAEMAARAYDGLARHKAEHAVLFIRLETILRPIRHHPSAKTADELLGFLVAWLGDHILGEDKLFAEFLMGRGIE